MPSILIKDTGSRVKPGMTAVLLLLGVSLIAGCFGKSKLKLGETDGGQVVGAVGFAPNDQSDLLKTKRASLTDAQRNAVSKAVGVYVSAKAMNEQAIQIENNILAQTEGYIKTFDVMKEEVKDGLYQTTIRALVATKNLEADLKDQGLLKTPELQRPRVYIILTESVDKAKTEEKPATTALSNKLIEQGFVIVGEDRVKDAELEIQGKVSAYPFQSEGLGGFVSYRARIDAKVVRQGTNDILFSYGKEASGLGGSNELAGRKALETIGELAGEQLGPKIEEKWGKGRHLIIYVENVQNFDQVDRIKKHISAQPGITDMVLRSYDEKMAQYEVRLGRLTPTDLATRLQKSKSLKMTVLETQPQSLRLKLD